ncbi:benzoate 4-monooxygenase cytochrome P450 [Penicillium alfredii]|uniref:Benzoate 4-monooxygenase cytochrome P450 n=1 Tax=Penicillium alfredii TaxID=1506179 RepID=A0A9W9G9Y5_9EURO|nr:benzoate 4-monooxygenase cytochrome P450 [Penicillium alfredii]KAJ5114818.1 benzoate 4-monooxygenase cytochrome P450 [Penicillium alfredii]
MILLLLGLFTFVWVILTPILRYFYDAKDLRKYPNQNFLSGLTSLAYVWERRNNFRTRKLYHDHQQHPIIRLGPTVLSFGDVGAIQDIYGHGTLCLKDDVYRSIQGDSPQILNVVDKEDHARKRRMLSNAFAAKSLEHWEFKIADKVKKLVAQFDWRCTDPLDGHPVDAKDLTINFRFWSNLFTLDAIADIALSERLGLLESGSDLLTISQGRHLKNFHFLESLHCGSRAVSRFVGATDWFPILKAASRLFYAHFRAHGNDFGEIVEKLAKRRIEKYRAGAKLNDFFACLIEDKAGNQRNLDRAEIEAETNILLDAGSDTTAIALTHVLYHLIKNPATLAKLREEVSDSLSGESIAPFSKVKSLPYLRACLDESLRLTPPLPRGLERKTPPQGMEILGKPIAGGITVSVPTFLAHRDPTLFPEPERYSPERWLDASDTSKEMRAAFIPFSSGGRACIGRNITIMEQQILVATLVHRYDFALPSDRWELDWEEAFNLWPCQMPIKIWRREVDLNSEA